MSRRKTWRCFHCDEVFTCHSAAAEHFGHDAGATPACKITAAESHLVAYIRRLESEVAAHRAEDSAVLRAYQSLEAQSREAEAKAEERGYDRGVQEAKALFDREGCIP